MDNVKGDKQMTEPVLTSNQRLPLRPLIETALASEVRLLEVGTAEQSVVYVRLKRPTE
jgi:hypothetical protein